MKLDRLDHLLLTMRDIDATIAFYGDVLGMEAVSFGAGRRAPAPPGRSCRSISATPTAS